MAYGPLFFCTESNPLHKLDFPQDLPSWGQVVKLSARFAKSKADLNDEILWPLTVYCLVSTPPDVDSFPRTMFCISGHGLVFAFLCT